MREKGVHTMIFIRSATIADAPAIGHVHHLSWMETYQGLIDEEYLKTRSEENSVETFEKEGCKDLLVAEWDGEIVGFVKFGASRDEDLPEPGEIQALYVLKKAQNKGIGRRLLEFAMRIQTDRRSFLLWVLAANEEAIQFYQHLGFSPDGTKKTHRAGDTFLQEIRMVRTLEEKKRGRSR